MRLTLQLSAIDNMSRVVSSAAQRSLNSLQQMQAGAQQRANEARSAMFDSGVMAAGGVAALAYPLKMAGNYERLRVSMDALTGSSIAGAEAFNAVVQMAKETPLSLDEVAKNSVMMMGYGQSAREAARSVKILGDITALTNGDMGNAIVAYGQARQEGKMLTRDLRQFINAGVPIISILKKQLGAQTDIFKMAEEGQISFALLEDALTKATQAGGQFANGMEKLSGTAPGLWMRLTDEVGQFAAIFGQSALPLLKSWGETLIPIIKSTGEFIKENKWLASTVMIAVGAFTAFAAIGFIVNGTIWVAVTAFSGFVKAIGIAGSVMTGVKWIFTSLHFIVHMTGNIFIWMGRALMVNVIPALLSTATAAWAAVAPFLAFIAPIALVAAVVVALAAYIYVAVTRWREFGATMLFLLGPIGWIVNGFIEIIAAWDYIRWAFADGGILNGLHAIGRVLFDSMLYPLQQLLGIIEKLTGFEWAKTARISIEQIRYDKDLDSVTQLPNSTSKWHNPEWGPMEASARTSLSPKSSSNSNSSTVNYSPVIHIGTGVTGAEKEEFTSMLERHKGEVARMVQESNRQQDRKSFNYA